VEGSDYGIIYALRPAASVEVDATERFQVERIPVPLFEPPSLGRAEMIQSIQVASDMLFCGCERGPIHVR